MASRQASSSSFSMNGSPTCTFGRFCFDSSVNSAEARSAVNPVAARFCADIDHGIADAFGFGERNFFFFGDAQGKRVDERVLRIARLERDFAADGGHAKTIPVAANSADDAVEDAAVFRGVRFAGVLARYDLAESQ